MKKHDTLKLFKRKKNNCILIDMHFLKDMKNNHKLSNDLDFGELMSTLTEFRSLLTVSFFFCKFRKYDVTLYHQQQEFWNP